MPFIITYIMTIFGVVAAVAAFMAVVHVRNRLVIFQANVANTIANPLATLSAELRGWAGAAAVVIPESAFAPGVLRRLIYLVTFALLTLADLTVTSERLSALYGLKPLDLPIDLTWASAIAWVITSGFFAAAFFELGGEDPGHPWNELRPRIRTLVRWLSAAGFVLVAVSAVLLWFWGALAAAGSYPLLPVVIFMSSLGLALTVAAGVCFWAAHDSWATLWGVVLIGAAIILIIMAYIPDAIVIAIRRMTYTGMSAADVIFLGFARPLLLWWVTSRLGRALGHPPLEEPTDFPEIGVPEEPRSPSAEDDDSDSDNLVHLPAFVRRLLREERAA